LNKAIFLELDNILVKTGIEKIEFGKGIIELGKYFKSKDFYLFGISNQPDKDPEDISTLCRAIFNIVDISEFYICNHSKDKDCECRMPKIASILEAK
jgi:histidinol phosphatase-like enzyme